MTTDLLLVLDLVAGAVVTAVWLGAGVTAAARRPRPALALCAVAVLATLARAGMVLALAGRGWWFAQEKATLALPLLGAAGVTAVLLAGPRLARAARSQRQDSSAGYRTAVVVPLLTAGYAAAGGLLVTILVGYPATWSVALITVALVGLAALVTWRVAVPAGPVPGMRAGVAATIAVGLVGVGLAMGTGGDDSAATGGHHGGHAVEPATLRGPAAPPGDGTVRRFTLTARTATITLSSGRRVQAWTFDGQVPGPPITAVEGDLVEVTLRNVDIRAGVTLHWHGYDVPAGEDGVPGMTQDAVMPGQEFVYRFVADQVGTYWYHTHEVSDRGVRMGLYGTLVVTPRGDPAPGLDTTVAVHTLAGVTVLGSADQPVRQRVAPGTQVRLRLVNTDNTPHRFTLAGTVYRLVAADGNDLNSPGDLTRAGLRLPAGGRYDLAFRAPDHPVALLVDNDRAGGLRLAPEADGGPAMAEDTAGWPELDLARYGTPAATPFDVHSRFDRHFTLVLDRGVALSGARPRYAYTVNGRAFPSIPTEVVRQGDLVRFTVVNRGRDTHPWHLHGHRVLVLARDGRAPTGSPLWLDTFDVRPGEVWDVAFRATNPGLWMNHCHNLSHADQGMMLHLAYEGFGT
ncbi:multicopper oxidase family protein [Dactylosporangium sp. CA-233914]|uniref:multicopper oxidase family protein n=1 Tax=Dactylosporangium sp. CA-233914 TaxID=3239934 RepID=UPI003D93B2D6